MKKPVNENYSANVVEIKHIIPIENCDNVVHANILGNLVIVGKDSKVGDTGIFFPVETEISKEFLSNNNLYRDTNLNTDKTKKGYFEQNGRIRAVKFRGNASMGFFIPLDSLSFTKHNEKLQIGDCFDEINNVPICKKYAIKRASSSKLNNFKHKEKRVKSILIENQFRYHEDTKQLGKNLHRISPDSIIHISFKIHGTSFISSNIKCKKKLSIWNKIGKMIGMDIIDTEYRNIYSSRRVIKNDDINKNPQHFYATDIWGLANEKIKDFLSEGMTVYGEIAGYLPDGKMIQGGYDYGCAVGEFKIYVYRITHTSHTGQVFEFSTQQMNDWCKKNGFQPVPELFYGRASDIVNSLHKQYNPSMDFQDNLLNILKEDHLERKCYICKTDVPAEGIVVRLDGGLDLEAYKYKSYLFYERETKMLDKGEEDIESQESVIQ